MVYLGQDETEILQGSGLELLEAWDEYTIDENVEGWREACEAKMNALQTPVQAQAVVVIDVSEDDLNKKLFPDSIPGSIPA